ncbi:hypothetical protein EMCRGX_G019592 [Ephydatia muelleri]
MDCLVLWRSPPFVPSSWPPNLRDWSAAVAVKLSEAVKLLSKIKELTAIDPQVAFNMLLCVMLFVDCSFRAHEYCTSTHSERKPSPVSKKNIFWYLILHVTCTCAVSSYLEPNGDYNVFVSNESTAAFYCSGVGIYINWLVNGLSINDVLVRQRGIVAIDDLFVGNNVSSTLRIPTTQQNNNTVVKCTVIKDMFVTETAPPATLKLQGSRVVMFAVNGAGNGNEATFQITADDQSDSSYNKSVSNNNNNQVAVIAKRKLLEPSFPSQMILLAALMVRPLHLIDLISPTVLEAGGQALVSALTSFVKMVLEGNTPLSVQPL